MSHAKVAQWLLALILLCAGAASCRPAGSRPALREEELPSNKSAPSSQEMIRIAAMAGPQYGCGPDWVVTFDEGNVRWKQFTSHRFVQSTYDNGVRVWPKISDDDLQKAILKRWPELKDHDYQLLTLGSVETETYDAGLLILLDRHTGAILLVLNANGLVLGPDRHF
jgi:hypothetical protein